MFTIVHRENKYTVFLVLKNLRKVIGGIVNQFVKNEAVVYTDEYVTYNNLINHEKITNHYTVNH
ncbi:MAG: hypothetical protein FWH54_00650 [Methanobrevibacter sp.]|nr:hypothetical protein [Methanobrevibacter sp.]